MCIRDRIVEECKAFVAAPAFDMRRESGIDIEQFLPRIWICLLYTSDAADERSSVDLGGRRIIKKKKQYQRRSDKTTTKKKRMQPRSITSTAK